MARQPEEVEVTTQAEFDACVKAGNIAACLSGYFRAYGSASVRAYGSASVRAYGSASVRAYGSASVTAYDSASVRAYDSASVTAYGSASVRAYDSASVRAYDSASVSAYGRVFVRLFSALKVIATAQVVILREPDSHGEVVGGHQIQGSEPKTAADWCDYHGIVVKDGVAVLYKGVNDKFMSAYGACYAPGTIPVADDWDGGLIECGRGLHFSPRPEMTLQFAVAKRFVACPVAVADMRAPKNGDGYLNKIKARGCVAPVWEVSRTGARISSAE